MENFELDTNLSPAFARAYKKGIPDFPTMQANAVGSYCMASNMHGAKDPKSIFHKVAAQTLRACQLNALAMGDY